MRELEVKVLNIDVTEWAAKLEAKGAVKLSEERQKNFIFDLPRDCLAGYLRIRSYHDVFHGEKKSLLTLKKKIKHETLREHMEIETEISDPDAMYEILRELGYAAKHINIKDRISYTFRGARFDLDTWEEAVGLPPYMEIEVESEAHLEELIQELNIDREWITNRSIRDFLEEKDAK